MLISVSIFYLVTRSYHLNYFALWNDEVFSVTVAKMPWPGMFRPSLTTSSTLHFSISC